MVKPPKIPAPAPTTTFVPSVGWRFSFLRLVPPSVTPWSSVTFSPTSAVSPMTTPIPWSMKSPGPSRGGGMDLDAGEEAADVREEPGRRPEAPPPEPVRGPVEPDRVDTGIAERHLERRASRGIALEDRANVTSHLVEHARLPAYAPRPTAPAPYRPALSAPTPPQTRAADRLRSLATSGSMDSTT